MKSRGLWLMSMAVAVTLAVCGLVGCSFVGEPTSAEDLLVRFASNPDNLNCAADAQVNMSLSLSGFRTGIPVSAHLDVADGSSHGTVEADMTKIDAGVQRYELYSELENNTLLLYVKRLDNGSSRWDRTKIDSSFAIDIPLLVDLLSDAKFMRVSYESDDQICYELTLPAASFVESALSMGDVTTSFGEIDEDQLVSMLGDSQLHFCFNEDCLVRSVWFKANFTYEDEDVIPVPVKVSFNMEAVMDGYGTIDPVSVAVPGTVRKESVLTDDPLYLDQSVDELMESAS